MSETYCSLILCHDDAQQLDNIKNMLSSPHETKEGSLGEYAVEHLFMTDHVMIASITGGVDIDALLDEMYQLDPEWFYIKAYYSNVGHEEKWCFKRGKKKTTLKTLTQAIRKKSRKTDLYYALINHEKDRLAQLLKDESINLDMMIHGTPLIFYVMAMVNMSLLKQLIKRGINIHERVTNSQWIELPVSPGTFEIIKGMNLLSVAVGLNAASVVRFLINEGLDVNAVDANGNTAINIAAKERSHHKFIEPLVQAGANINHENLAGRTPLFTLLESWEYNAEKTITMAQHWMNLGADIKHVSQDGTNAYWLVMNKDAKLIDFVKSQGVTEYRVPDGLYDDMKMRHKLEKAIWLNDIPSFKSWLDVESLNKKQQVTLLHEAARYGRMEIIQYMVQQGVPPYLMKDGYFAHQEASNEKQTKVARFLKEQVADFIEESRNRVKAVRPLYNSLMDAFAIMDQQDAALGEKYLAPLDPFKSHPFMSQLEPHQLEHWAGMSVRYGKERLTTKVNDEFDVVFIRGDLHTGIAVKISTSGNPLITRIGSGDWLIK